MSVRSSSSFVDKTDAALRRNGVVRLMIESGATSAVPPANDWLHELLVSSFPVKNAIRSACARCMENADQESQEVVPGLWMVSFGVFTSGRNDRTCCILIPTTDLKTSEFLDLMCQAARLDKTIVSSMINDLDLVEATDIPRYGSLMHLIGLSESEISRRTSMLADLGKQLGECYEEIHLYHTLIGNTSVSTTPTAFLNTVVEELHRVLPFSWIGVRVDMNSLNLPQIPNGIVISGPGLDRQDGFCRFGDSMIKTMEGREPVIFDPSIDERFDVLGECGSSAVVCPIYGDSGVVGVLFAGTRSGDSEIASSIETKLLGAAAEHVSVFLRNASLYVNLDSMFLGTVQGMVSAIDAKDRYTRGHSQRVAWLARALAAQCGLPESVVRRIYLAGLVHDVGKIGVPEQVLQKTGKLDDEEFAWIRKHPEMGSRILKDIPQMDDILPAVLHHHERWDGGGYPGRLVGEDIPIIARIVALADAFDAMSSTRTYRSARPREFVLAEIRRCSGTQFDPALVDPFLSIDFTEYDLMVIEHGGLIGGERSAA